MRSLSTHTYCAFLSLHKTDQRTALMWEKWTWIEGASTLYNSVRVAMINTWYGWVELHRPPMRMIVSYRQGNKYELFSLACLLLIVCRVFRYFLEMLFFPSRFCSSCPSSSRSNGNNVKKQTKNGSHSRPFFENLSRKGGTRRAVILCIYLLSGSSRLFSSYNQSFIRDAEYFWNRESQI